MTTQHTTIGDVFSAGAEQFHHWSPTLWDPVGAATALAAAPATGERVRARFTERLSQAAVADLDVRILTGVAFA